MDANAVANQRKKVSESTYTRRYGKNLIQKYIQNCHMRANELVGRGILGQEPTKKLKMTGFIRDGEDEMVNVCLPCPMAKFTKQVY